jgi:DNA-binding LacI/PurR family transcriptional regulator
MQKRVTLKEVAALAGVSYQTVSKVLNHQVQVTKETEQRIFEAFQQLDYRPNLIARSMRSQRTHLIGYSWAPAPLDQGNVILDQFLHSMTLAAENWGYHLLAFPYRPGNEWLGTYRELIDTHRVDGFVLSSVEYNDPRVAYLLERKFPFVAFGRANPDWLFPYVDVDGGAGMRAVAEHLIERGHRRIAALAWPEDSRVGQNRMEGFEEAHRQAGLPIENDLLVRGEGVFEFGYQAVKKLFEAPASRRPTAIAALNDTMAIGAMRAALEMGLRVGEDLALTGFDDSPLIQYLAPPLTSVRQPLSDLGRHIMEVMAATLEEDRDPCLPGSAECLLLPPRLIIRESSSARFSSEP